ncbi:MULTISPECIES: HpcH/HpaI aldolase/citrate lyase family protein [unclassified Sporosarcina]|uniref:HpcH/HpaI aldolase family protein n=1 Tax=unclassified Sporosarcina TaxID=2647733 RepID=UPI00203C727C|nr:MULTISPECIES: aldolase/citrate lyase family protein [unclassified Sporosarcina]GKV65912.1 hypothetical protein NCCP2331_20650 [Sporosarcina sp. NCCP-2331]GLB56088.1 hypothetical protein NCCP2378_18750 [Sporosarcina sp. NCCP-2378]
MNNHVKQKILNGERSMGAFLGIYSTAIVEMMGLAGYEFIVIDDEHGTFDHSELENMIRTAENVGIVPIVRVSYDESSIQKALDKGAKGIHVPMVNSREDAEMIVQKAKFPPYGKRGAAFSTRAAKFGKRSGETYLRESDAEILIVVHIETLEAAERFEEIMSVDGIDLAFLGPTDLSVSMGYPTEGASHPEVRSVLDELFRKGKQLNIPIGTLAVNKEATIDSFDRGAVYVGVLATALISTAFNDLSADVKEKL